MGFFSYYSIMDICSYCEVATESIQKNIEAGNFDGATIQLCAYLLEIHSRYHMNEIDEDTWKETLRFYRRMNVTINEELSLQRSILEREKEISHYEDHE